MWLLLLLLAGAAGADAQIRITTPYPAAAGNLTRGGLDTTALTVQVTFNGSCSNVLAKVSFPLEVYYVPGTVVRTSGSIAGASIAYSSGPLSAPVFSITGITGAGDITFSLKRVALCGVNGAGKDTVSVSGGCGPTFTEKDPAENSYVILAPSLTFIPPANNTTAVVGANIPTRTDTITNGGNGCLDTISYYIVLPRTNLTMQDDPVFTITAKATTVASGTPAASFTPVSIAGDTLFYRLYGPVALGAGSLLCNGGTVVISENLKVTGCGATSIAYGAGWGRNNAYCQPVTAIASVTPVSGTPSFTFKTLPLTQSVCPAANVGITDSLYSTNTVPVIYDSLVINPGTVPSNSWIDTASIMIGYPGVPAYHPSGGFTVNTVNSISSALSAASGMPVKVTYRFPVPVTLNSPAALAVTYNLRSDYNDNPCTASYTASSYVLTHYYHLRCTPNTAASRSSSGYSRGFTVSAAAGTMQTPAVVPTGGTFNLKVPIAYVLPTTVIFPNRYGEIRLTLPAGVELVTARDLADTAATSVSVSGNVITYRFLPNASAKQNYINFQLRNTAACGNQTIAASYTVGLDSLCTQTGSRYVGTSCATSLPIKFGCPPGSGTGTCTGVSALRYAFTRSSLGLPDSAQKGYPNGVMLDSVRVDRDRYLVGDTLRSVSSGIIAGQAPGNVNFPYVYADWFFTAGTWDTTGTATVIIKRGNTTYTCNNVSFITANVTGYSKWWRAIWRTNACMTGVVNYQPGDSIAIVANFRLKPNYTSNTTELGGGNTSGKYTYARDTVSRVMHLLFASTVASTTTPSPAAGGAIGSTGYTCDTALYNAYISGWRHTLTANTATTSGCSYVTADFYSQTNSANAAGGGQYFLGEYRPVWIPDSFVVKVPAGWDYYNPITGIAPPSFMQYTTRRGAFDTAFYNIIPTVTIAADSTTLLYNYYNAFRNGTISFAGSEGGLYRSSFQLRPSTCSTATATNYSVREYGHIADPFGITISSYMLIHAPTASSGNLRIGTRPALTVSSINSTASVIGTAPQQVWDVQIATNAYTAPYVWFAMERGDGSVTIDSASYLNAAGTATTGTIAATTYSTFNRMYQLTTSLAANGNQKVRIYFHYGNCTLDSARIIAGYDCNRYPSVPGNAVCSVSPYSTMTAPLYLKVAPRSSKVQLDIKRNPGDTTTVSFCATDSTIVVMNSAAEANIVSPRLQIAAPAGLVLNSTIPVEYPFGSGNWQNLTPVYSGGVYELDLSGHTGIGLPGIKGTLANPKAEGRQAKVKLIYTTDCAYRSGSKIGFTALANSVCGTPAPGNNNKIQSKPLTLTGFTGGGTIDMALTLPATTLNCSNRATMTFSSKPLGTPTENNDTLIYTLPAGIAYGGSFSVLANCAGCTAFAVPGQVSGTTDVKIKLPANMPAGTDIRYQFDIIGTGGGCGAVTIDATAVRGITGLFCAATNTSCSNSSRLVGAQSSGTINLVRPDINLTDIATISGDLWGGKTASLRVAYQNNGGEAAAANAYKIEFFCSGSAAPIYTGNVRKAMAVGASAADTFSFTIPAGCARGSILSARVAPVLADNSAQCVCASRSAALTGSPLPVQLIDFTARRQDASVALAWSSGHEADAVSYTVERSEDAKGFRAIGTVTAYRNGSSVNSYRTTDGGLPEAAGLYYRLRINEQNGDASYSKVVYIAMDGEDQPFRLSPNPANDQLTIRLHTAAGGTGLIRVLDAVGRVVADRTVVLNKGMNTVLLDGMASLPDGMYILQLPGTGLPAQRFQIRH